MIIGINGKIGSGKDTVGKIIQYLTSECGNSNSSRHRTYAEFLKRGGGSNLRNFDQHYVSDWEVKKFAGKLKTTASLLTGIDVEKFEDQEFKKTFLGQEWDYIEYMNNSPRGSITKMTIRELLQKLGTEAMRDGLHTNVWVNALFADYNAGYTISPLDVDNQAPDNWIITDMRFPNEMEAVVEKGGLTIRVVRDYALRGGPEDPKNIHPSETALDEAKFDYEIINDGTIEDLIEKVREILINENII
jgi:hypothetical protein